MANGVWSIRAIPASTQGYSIDPDTGVAHFPENSTSEDITYTITYTEGGIVCEKTVIQEGTGCRFLYGATTSTIPYNGKNGFEFGTFSNVRMTNLNSLIIEFNPSVVSNKRIINNKLLGDVSINDTQAERVISYTIKTSNGGLCAEEQARQRYDSITIYRNPDTNTQTPDPNNDTPNNYTFSDGCVKNKQWIIVRTEDSAEKKDVVFTIAPNEWCTIENQQTYKTNTYYMLTFSEIQQEERKSVTINATVGSVTTSSIVFDAACQTTCTCDDIELKATNQHYSTEDTFGAPLGYIQFNKKDCFNINDVSAIIEPENSIRNIWFEKINLQPYTDRWRIWGTLTESDKSRIINCLFKMNDNLTCGPIKIYQQCFRGTDNGVDVYYDKDGNELREEHPILLYANICESTGEGLGESDTILVPNCKIKTGDTSTDSDWVLLTDLPSEGIVFDGWLTVKHDATGYCEYGSISVIADEYTETASTYEEADGKIRKYSIWLKTDEGATICNNASPEQHPGEKACEIWEYPVWQPPVGYGWCKIYDNENRVALLIKDGECCSDEYADKWDDAQSKGEKHGQDSCESCSHPQLED